MDEEPVLAATDLDGGDGIGAPMESGSSTSREELYRRYTEGFVCRECAGFIYESVERRSRPLPGYRVDCWDRFVKRISGGVLGGDDVGGDLNPA